MKYSSDTPDRFGSLEDAFAFLRSFIPWYNSQHHHSGIATLTPESVHYERANLVQARHPGNSSGSLPAPPQTLRGETPPTSPGTPP